VRIAALDAAPLDITLREPFGIATGAQLAAHNVLVTLRLEDGGEGIGEAAPFPAVNGETQAQVLAALGAARPALIGQDARSFRRVSAVAQEAMAATPSALCAFESALLDALTRHAGLSLWTFFGGADTSLVSDITIPTGTAADAERAAKSAITRGFDTLKIKVGGAPFDHDRIRLAAVARAAPRAKLVLDANASFDAATAVELLLSLGDARSRVVLYEQPTSKYDRDGLRRVRELGKVLVAADESAGSAADVIALARERAADVINIKIMKCGVLTAVGMVEAARAAGLGLMVGGMVESKLAMSVSACLAAGFGGFSFVDLDTPWFMQDTPFQGGWQERGATLSVAGIERGHGVSLLRPSAII
jgi:L-alanine-DL-glutamate epimerase-like enolase superfamily enzyme